MGASIQDSLQKLEGKLDLAVKDDSFRYAGRAFAGWHQ
jgi:hypothetical protein